MDEAVERFGIAEKDVLERVSKLTKEQRIVDRGFNPF